MQKYHNNIASLYLFSAPYGSDGLPIPNAKVKTVPNCLLFHRVLKCDKPKRNKEDVSAGEPIWRPIESDKDGVLFSYKIHPDELPEQMDSYPDPDRKSQYRFMTQQGQTKKDKTELRVQMLPLSDVNAMMAAWGPEQWQKKIADILGPGDGILAQIENFSVDDIENGAEIAKGQKALSGLVLPRFRTLLVTFSSKRFENANVVLKHANKEKDGQLSTRTIVDAFSIITDSETCVAPFCIPESDIQNGFYQLIIDVSEATDISSLGSIGGPWRSTDDPTSSQYELMVYLDFPLHSPLGNMQIVNGDPISLEEWLLQQYPDQYALYRFRSIKDPDKSIEAKARSKGELTITHIANTAAAINKWGSTTLSGSSKADLYWSILDAVKGSDLIKDSELLKGSVNLALASKELRDKLTDPKASYNEIRKMLKEVKNGQSALKSWFGQVPESFFKEAFGKFTLDLPKDQAYKETWASRLNIDKRHFAQWKRATNVAGTVLSLNQSADDISGAWKNIAKQEELLEDKLGELTAMVRDYHNAAGYLKPESNRNSTSEGSITDDQFVQALAKRVTRQIGALDLQFENDKWELKADDAHNRKCLDQAVQVIESAGGHPVRVTIDGHTSSPGSVAYNHMLSQKRADAVRTALETRGVKAEIQVNAYGEAYPILDAAGNEDQAASRRVVICIEGYDVDTTPHYLACREAMKKMTLVCDRSIAARIDMQEAWGKLVCAAAAALYDGVAMILRVIPVTAVVGNAMVLAKDAYELADAAAATGKEALELISMHALSDALQYHKELQAIGDRSTGNQMLLRDAASSYLGSETKDAEGDDEIRRVNSYLELQLRMRYEAVNGLMGLLKRAANESTNTDDYNKWLEKHKVDAYIKKYLLNDKWLMPTKHVLPMAMDEFWLFHLMNEKIEGAFENKYVQSLFKTGYGELEFRKRMIRTICSVSNISNATFNAYNSQIKNRHLPGMAEAHTQRLYPLHYLSSKNLEAFATLLKTDSTEINDQSVAHTAIYFRECVDFDNSVDGWKPVSRYRNASGQWTCCLSPLYPICIVVILERYETHPFDDPSANGAGYDRDRDKYFVLKDGKPIAHKNGYYPYTLKQYRYDGWNVEGLSYSGLMKPLTRKDLPAQEHHWFDRDATNSNERDLPLIGAVIYPYFQYGPVTYHGTRPVLSDHWYHRLYNTDLGVRKDIRNKASEFVHEKAEWDKVSLKGGIEYLNSAWKYGHFDDMRYGFELRLGKDGKYARPIRVWGDERDWSGGRWPWIRRKIRRFGTEGFYDTKSNDEYAVGKNFGDEYAVNIDLSGKRKVPIGDTVDSKTGAKVTAIDVKDERLLLDADFLRSGKQDYKYPKLFKGRVRTNLLFRFGESNGKFVGLSPAFFKNWDSHPSIRFMYHNGSVPYQHPNPGLQGQTLNRCSSLDVEGFDWYESLECAVTVSCDEVLTEKYQSEQAEDQKNWQRIPFSMKIEAGIECDKSGLTEGPRIAPVLYYLGYADTQNGIFHASQTQNDAAAGKLTEILLKFSSGDPDERARALHILGVSHDDLHKTLKRHVFCAYYPFRYQAPTGKEVKSLRPFGKGHLFSKKELSTSYYANGSLSKPEYIKDRTAKNDFFFFFSDLQSAGDSGVEKFDWTPAEQESKILPFYASSLRIKTPDSFLRNVPWVEMDSEDLTDANGKPLEQRTAENDSIDMGVAKYAETPQMHWARLKNDDQKLDCIKKWMENEQMAKSFNQNVPTSTR